MYVLGMIGYFMIGAFFMEWLDDGAWLVGWPIVLPGILLLCTFMLILSPGVLLARKLKGKS